jgi:hypothetical protein
MKLEGMHQPTASRQPRRVLLPGRDHLAGLPGSEDSDDVGEQLLLAPSGHSLSGLTNPSQADLEAIGARGKGDSARGGLPSAPQFEMSTSGGRAVRRPIPRWRRRIGGHRDG